MFQDPHSMLKGSWGAEWLGAFGSVARVTKTVTWGGGGGPSWLVAKRLGLRASKPNSITIFQPCSYNRMILHEIYILHRPIYCNHVIVKLQ